MSSKNFARKRVVVAVGLALAAMPLIASANQARVDFSFGEVSVKRSDGIARALAKGAMVGSGDTIVTGNNARVQLRFSDGSYVSLQPESEFRIDQYQFSGQQDGSERGLFSLLKGGLRTITGLVGRSNKKNYQVSTGVATIGIRGTEYSISADGTVRGSVGDGEIQVCNGGGCLVVANGESYKVATAQTQALMTEKKVDLPAPPVQPGVATINVGGPGAANGGLSDSSAAGGGIIVPTLPIGDTIVAEKKDDGSIVTPIVPIIPASDRSQVLARDGTDASSGTLFYAHAVPGWIPAGYIYDGVSEAIAFDVRGSTYTHPGAAKLEWTHYLNATVRRFSDVSPVAIGGYFPSWHQITGISTPLSAMPTMGTATYSFIGGTQPTSGNGLNVYVGSVHGGSLSVDFGTGTSNFSVTLTMPPNIAIGTATFSGTGQVIGNMLRFDTLVNPGASCRTCWAGSASGFFAGSNAEAVGIGYKVQDENGHRAVGVIGFEK